MSGKIAWRWNCLILFGRAKESFTAVVFEKSLGLCAFPDKDITVGGHYGLGSQPGGERRDMFSHMDHQTAMGLIKK